MTLIYLDHNATTPIDPAVAEAMKPLLYGGFGNPSSAHPLGIEARAAVARARGQIAGLINAAPSEILFTSGGTESDNHALRGVAALRPGCAILTSAVEHPAILNTCRRLAREGHRVEILPVDARGRLHPETLEAAMSPEVGLVSVMLANNEVGTIQPIAALAAVAHAGGALFHTDAAQAVGKISVDVEALGVDLLTIAGHKLYAPKGIGALYIRQGLELPPMMEGAAHEGGRRAGTESTLLIAGLGAACALCDARLEADIAHAKRLRDRIERGLTARLGGAVQINGDLEARLPNTSNLSIRGIASDTLLAEIGDRVAASAGAACHADEVEPSPVLAAIGLATEWAMGTLRLSVGRGNTEAEIDAAVGLIADAAVRLGAGGAAPESAPVGEVKLTRYTHGLGCACKLRPQDLERILAKLPVPTQPELSLGVGDDAAVWRLDDERALVLTADFFTPVLDDPADFGAVAAANALSDVYAMGARPLCALNLVGFPVGRLPLTALEAILGGAAEATMSVGVPLVGGHTIDSPEPIFGLAVLGEVHPDRLWRKAGARPGDGIVLTKPLGTGVLSTALKQGLLDAAGAARLTAQLKAINDAAARVASGFEIHAATDVTGFGLLGHLLEVLVASEAGATLEAGRVPLMEGALEMLAAGALPGGTAQNAAHVAGRVRFEGVDEGRQVLLADAQTSGGLLLVTPQAEALAAALVEAGLEAALIGEIVGGAAEVEVRA